MKELNENSGQNSDISKYKDLSDDEIHARIKELENERNEVKEEYDSISLPLTTKISQLQTVIKLRGCRSQLLDSLSSDIQETIAETLYNFIEEEDHDDDIPLTLDNLYDIDEQLIPDIRSFSQHIIDRVLALIMDKPASKPKKKKTAKPRIQYDTASYPWYN